MSVNYKELYYFDFGEYPQSQETNSTIINAMGTTADLKGYYTSSANGKKYALKDESYYKVEPVRWLIIGNGSGLNGLGFPDKNGNNGNDLASNQLLLISEKILADDVRYHSSHSVEISWTSSELYLETLPNLKNLIFSKTEKSNLGTFVDDNSQLSILSYNLNAYKYLNYGNSSVFKAVNSNFSGNLTHYWLKATSQYSSYGGYYFGGSINKTTGEVFWGNRISDKSVLRPIIILNV